MFATPAQSPENAPASLEPLLQLVAADMAAVNQVIIDNVASDISLITDIARYIVSAGGKRLRPALTLAAARLCGYEGTRHIHLAACVEFIHTATLLHDDVVDASTMRRGQPTANDVWSNQSSVLVGDFLFSRAFQLMVADGHLDVLRLLSDTSAIIAEGEVHQLMTVRAPDTSEEVYLKVIRAKTAALFAAAAEIGAHLAEKESLKAPLNRLGESLGIAFQLVDDALDYMGDSEMIGKNIGDDFREGKITLPVIVAYREGGEECRQFLHRCFENGDIELDDLTRLTGWMHSTKALDTTLALAETYAAIAREQLMLFPPSPLRAALENAIAFTVSRNF